MNFAHFLRIERDERDGSRHFVVHMRDPKFSLELAPDLTADDQVGQGVIKRICVPNSWSGDYGQYAKLVKSAQKFFNQSFTEPATKPGGSRLKD